MTPRDAESAPGNRVARRDFLLPAKHDSPPGLPGWTVGTGEGNAYDQPCHGASIHSLQKRGAMAEQAISCPSCGKKIPLTRALRAEIEGSVREQYDEALQKRERELKSEFAERMKADVQRVASEAATTAEKKA